MGERAERNREQIREWGEWISHISTMSYPDSDSKRDILRKYRCVKPPEFMRFKLTIIHAFSEYGRYGVGMNATAETIAEPFGIHEKRAERDLHCAAALGLVEPDGYGSYGTKQYRIVPRFWETERPWWERGERPF